MWLWRRKKVGNGGTAVFVVRNCPLLERLTYSTRSGHCWVIVEVITYLPRQVWGSRLLGRRKGHVQLAIFTINFRVGVIFFFLCGTSRFLAASHDWVLWYCRFMLSRGLQSADHLTALTTYLSTARAGRSSDLHSTSRTCHATRDCKYYVSTGS